MIRIQYYLSIFLIHTKYRILLRRYPLICSGADTRKNGPPQNFPVFQFYQMFPRFFITFPRFFRLASANVIVVWIRAYKGIYKWFFYLYHTDVFECDKIPFHDKLQEMIECVDKCMNVIDEIKTYFNEVKNFFLLMNLSDTFVIFSFNELLSIRVLSSLRNTYKGAYRISCDLAIFITEGLKGDRTRDLSIMCSTPYLLGHGSINKRTEADLCV